MCGGPSVAPQRLVACQASLLATGKRVEEEPGESSATPAAAIGLKVAPALLAALQQPEQLRSPGFSELLDECAEKAAASCPSCWTSRTVPELLRHENLETLRPVTSLSGSLASVQWILLELSRLAASGPVAALLAKPPEESVLIVVDGRAEDVYLFDCRPRPWLQQSYVAKFPTLSALASFLEELFPNEGLQGEAMNELTAYPFVMRLDAGPAWRRSDSNLTRQDSDMQALQCPITKELMADPVLATDGYTYERQSIEQHWANQLQGQLSSSSEDGESCGGQRLAAHLRTSPVTGQELDGTLRVNRVVLDLIRAAIEGGRVAPEVQADWERRRADAEHNARKQLPEAPSSATDDAQRAPNDGLVASAPPLYECSAEHVRVVGPADPPRWGLAAKVQPPKTGLACDFVEVDHWAPSFMFTSCMVPGCGRAFGLFRRRHHCRRCGRLVCSSCSPHVAVNFEQLGVVSATPELGRICGECVEDTWD
ncbi:FYVE-type zinc finger-containing protein C9B6.03 [Durusdinium trenchii]|uniref:FYVE-type zinc finger-containing protein C9B6.03 n=2 Tax=Durusdinium trenchii TaxID=1381693 RepID=A0ABP0JQ57_9DINO